MKNLGKFIVIAALLAIISAGASAADLRLVGSNDNMEVSVDVDTIKTVVGSHTEVVVVSTYRDAQKIQGLPPFRATIARVFFRCLNGTGSISKLHLYDNPDLKGSPIARFDYPVEWRPVDHKTDIGIVWKYICTRGWERDTQ